MIAYFSEMITNLASIIIHKLGCRYDKKAILFIQQSMYLSRGVLDSVKRLKEYGLFSDVVDCMLAYPGKTSTSITITEDALMRHYDQMFLETGYDLSCFEEIIVTCDNWGCDYNIYFNLKKIDYIWMEMAVNNTLNSVRLFKVGKLEPFYIRYKVITPFAESVKSCIILSGSDQTAQVLNQAGKPFEMWDRNDCLNHISPDDMGKIYDAFGMNQISFDAAGGSVLLIKNSFGYLQSKIPGCAQAALSISQYNPHDFYTTMDKLAMDFYAPDLRDRVMFLKNHIHDPVGTTDAKRLWGEQTVVLPNVPFEFLTKYFAEKAITFDYILGTASTSLTSVDKRTYRRMDCLGVNYAKTWWMYLSVYAVVCLAQRLGVQTIYAGEAVCSQINALAERQGVKATAAELILSEFSKLKNALIVIDMCEKQEVVPEKTDKTSAVVFLNQEFAKSFPKCSKVENFTPVVIRKEKLAEQTCDCMLRKETLWIYAESIQTKSALRRFTFEKRLAALGMRIYAEEISMYEATLLLEAARSYEEREALTRRLQSLENNISGLAAYIRNPKSAAENLRNLWDIHQYLFMLNVLKERYGICLAVRDTPGDKLSDEIVASIHQLGFESFDRKLWHMYAGVNLHNMVFLDISGSVVNEPAACSMTYKDIHISVSSQAWRNGNQASVVINGTDYAANVRGINLVVYDLEKKEVVDSVGYDAHVKKEGVFKRI